MHVLIVYDIFHIFFETTASFTLFLWEYILLNLFERVYTTLYWQDIYIFCREYILRLWRVYTGCIRYLLAREYIPLLIFLEGLHFFFRWSIYFSMEYIPTSLWSTYLLRTTGVYTTFFMEYTHLFVLELLQTMYNLFKEKNKKGMMR